MFHLNVGETRKEACARQETQSAHMVCTGQAQRVAMSVWCVANVNSATPLLQRGINLAGSKINSRGQAPTKSTCLRASNPPLWVTSLELRIVAWIKWA